jgi:Flp pilus assembly protein TadB
MTGSVVAAASFAALALWLLTGPSPAVHRLHRLTRSAPPDRAAARRRNLTALAGSAPGRWAVAALAGLAVALFLPGWLGIAAGTVLTVGGYHWLSRQETAAARAVRLSVARDLPLAAELLSAAVHAGVPLGRGIDAVAGALGGPLGERLRTCREVELRVGDPLQAWQPLVDDPTTAELARLIAESALHGTAPAAALSALAADLRTQARLTADGVARSLGARVAAPLGLCFLPAFLLLGVVPMVAAAAAALIP